MSKNDVTVSNEEQDGAEPDSVFDFLYHDSRRIASFLSQFDANGLLTGLTQRDHVSKDSKRSKKFEVGADVPIFGGGNVGFELGPGESGSQSLERVYDPFWANARQFLDALEENNLIQRDIENANMGQFVLATGRLIIADLLMLKNVWNLPATRDALEQAMAASGEHATEMGGSKPTNRQQRRAQGKSPPKAKPLANNPQLEMVMQLLPHLPHSGQAHLVTDEFGIWATLEASSLVGSLSDLVLKHGNKLVGKWAMLGILDGKPFDHESIFTPMDHLRTGGVEQGQISRAAVNLGPIVRQTLGRPLGSYGMTPLVIFREVA